MRVYRNAIPKSILFYALFAMVTLCLPAASTGAGDAVRTVQPVDGGIPGEIFQLEIVLSGLRRLGYAAKPTIVLPQEAGTPHLLVAQGDADFFAGHWDPLHKSFFEEVGGEKRVARIGTLIDGCMQGYLIDRKTADRYDIRRLEQLADPQIAGLFDIDGNGRADLAGCHPGWGCWRVIEHQLTAFGLRDTVEHHQDADYFQMIEGTIARYRAGEPIFYYTWTPLWVSGVLVPGRDTQWLTVPFTALPEERVEKETTLADGRNLGFAVNRVRILANKRFLKANPKAKRFFEQVSIPIDDISAQNMRMREGEDSQEDIERHAREWIEQHRAQFERWVSEAQKAGR